MSCQIILATLTTVCQDGDSGTMKAPQIFPQMHGALQIDCSLIILITPRIGVFDKWKLCSVLSVACVLPFSVARAAAERREVTEAP